MDIVNSSGGAPGADASVAAAPRTVPASGPGAADPGAVGPAAAASPGTGPLGATPPGAARLSVGTPIVDVKVNAVAPSETSGMDAASVMDILRNLDVEGVREAASAHTALGETLERIAENLVANGQTLAGSWQGDAAQAAVTKFQQMHAQASQIAAQAKQTGQALEWTASVMDKYRKLPNPLGDPASLAGQPADTPGAAIGDVIAAVAGAAAPGAGHQAKANAQARKYLNELNQHLVTANGSLPSSIGHSAAVSPAGAAHGGTAAGVPGGTGHAVGGPASSSAYPGTVAGSGPGGPSGAPAPAFTPAAHATPAGALQSSAVPGGGAGTLTPSAPAPSAPGGGAMPGLVPLGPVPGTSKSASGSLGNTTEEEPSEEESGLASAEDTQAADSGTAIGDRKQGSVAGEGSALPMMGGAGAGQPEQERLRESWMNEDQNVWGVPQGTVGSEIGSH